MEKIIKKKKNYKKEENEENYKDKYKIEEIDKEEEKNELIKN